MIGRIQDVVLQMMCIHGELYNRSGQHSHFFSKSAMRYVTITMLTIYVHILIYYNIFEFGDDMNRGSGDMDLLRFR